MLWISCGHTTPPIVRVDLNGYTYEVCGGRRCRALLPDEGKREEVEVEVLTVPYAPYDERAQERQLVAA
jgi:hypothetical protein